jgi:peptidoglycan/LPS O-acetylase OafA/YrhL
MASRARFEELDALRGIAAFWVLLFHYVSAVPSYLPDQPDLVARIVPVAFNFEGLYAVHLFFMISGFVIMMTVDRSARVREFAVSRIARLYPAFWCAVAVGGALSMAWPLPSRPVVTVPQILGNVSMLHDFIGVRPVDDVYWSLTFELGFYGLAALMLAAGQTKRAELLAFCWVVAAFPLLHLLPKWGLALPWRVQAITALPYAGLFSAGLVFYHVWADRLTVWRVALLALCFVQATLFAGNLVLVLTAIFFAVFALCVAGYGGFLRQSVLLWLGGISYSLYLIHGIPGIRVQIAMAHLGLPAWLNLAVAVAVALLLAWAISVWVERPGGAALRRAAVRWGLVAPAKATVR